MTDAITRSDRVAELHPDAVGFSAFRALPNGAGRQYTQTMFHSGRRGASYWLRRFAFLGMVRDSSTATDGYAVLDVLNADGDIVQDYDVPTAQAFRYIKRMLKLAVVDTDAVVAELTKEARP